MASSRGDAKSKRERQQTILRLIQEYPISRQESLLDYLRKEGFDATQATISRDIRELSLVKAATSTGYRYVSSHNEALNPKIQGRFETIFHESGTLSGDDTFLIVARSERDAKTICTELTHHIGQK